MSLLLKNALVADPKSPFNGQKVNILIEQKKIKSISQNIQENEKGQSIDLKGAAVSPGWVDIFADYADPGFEHNETLESGIAAAAAGGFTDVFLVPNTAPVVSNFSTVKYLLQRSQNAKIQIHPLGSVTQNAAGKDIAEMLDMKSSGAIAFSDGWNTIQNAGVLVKALEYVKVFDGVIIQVPGMNSLSEGGLMNESENSVRFGIASIPEIAESIMVYRDLELAKYADSRIHLTGISTKKSLELIKAAKKDGVKVTCSVTPYHLLFSDGQLEGYDSLYKVNPPLRTETDKKALINALKDGTIDCIATHHHPIDWDGKVKELEYSVPGMAIQEVTWNALLKAAPQISDERWAELLSINARAIFGLPTISIQEGAPAKLTWFKRDSTRIFNKKMSKAFNVPFYQTEIKGEAGII